jgi:hypothetical protein
MRAVHRIGGFPKCRRYFRLFWLNLFIPAMAVGIMTSTMRLMDATRSRQVWRAQGAIALGQSRDVRVMCDMQGSEAAKANSLEVPSTV